MLTLSYSKARMYGECGQKYDYHYNQRIRERTKSGALFFGTAFDKAVEAVLKDRSVDEYAVFDKWWDEQDINGEGIKLRFSPKVVYAESDMDWDLLTVADIATLGVHAHDLGLEDASVKEAYDRCREVRKKRSEWTVKDRAFYNHANWLCLRQKGHILLKAHRDQVLWRIKEVVSTQETIRLDDGVNALIGYPDAEVVWEDGSHMIIDYKTSSIEYKYDSVRTSPQLALYCNAKGLTRAGFIVFRKQITKNKTKVCSLCGADGSGGRHKTCPAEIVDASKPDEKPSRCDGEWTIAIRPEGYVQFVFDTISEATQLMIMGNYDLVAKSIENGVFTRNFSACEQGYGPCAYKRLCFGGDASELEKIS